MRGVKFADDPADHMRYSMKRQQKFRAPADYTNCLTS